jgi:hypothetical protein
MSLKLPLFEKKMQVPARYVGKSEFAPSIDLYVRISIVIIPSNYSLITLDNKFRYAMARWWSRTTGPCFICS